MAEFYKVYLVNNSFYVNWLSTNYPISNFTGSVTYEKLDGSPLGRIRMENGIPKTKVEAKSVSNRISCYNQPIVVAVQCTAGDHHYPGEAFEGTADQQPYYDVVFMLHCAPEEQIYNDDGGGGGSYAGGGDWGHLRA